MPTSEMRVRRAPPAGSLHSRMQAWRPVVTPCLHHAGGGIRGVRCQAAGRQRVCVRRAQHAQPQRGRHRCGQCCLGALPAHAPAGGPAAPAGPARAGAARPCGRSATKRSAHALSCHQLVKGWCCSGLLQGSQPGTAEAAAAAAARRGDCRSDHGRRGGPAACPAHGRQPAWHAQVCPAAGAICCTLLAASGRASLPCAWHCHSALSRHRHTARPAATATICSQWLEWGPDER